MYTHTYTQPHTHTHVCTYLYTLHTYTYIHNSEAASRKVMMLLAKITKNAKAAGAQDVMYIKTPNTITLDAGRRFRKVQIITNLYAAKSNVLNTFDIACCGFGYDGSDCLFVNLENRAAIAVNQKVNIVDLQLRETAYEHRLTEYATRGFPVGVPGLDKSDIIDDDYFKVKCEASTWGGTDFVGDGWSWSKWQECPGTLERLLLNEAIGASEGALEKPFAGRLRKEVLPVDKVKHILLMPTGHDIDMYPRQSCLKNRPSETFSPATLRFMDFLPPPLSKTSAAGNKQVSIGWGKGIMPRQPVSWAEWTKGVLKSGSQKSVPFDYEWTKQADERRKQAKAEKLKEQEEKNNLIAIQKQRLRQQSASRGREKNAELLAKLAGAVDQEKDEEVQCVVCMEDAADYAFLPCGHRCVCRTDAEMIHTSTRTCPICRQPTQSFNKIFAA
jgi:hypothetical protein